jgi:hypothetical protein
MTGREERIRERAHKLWQEAGEPDGRHNEFWTRAEMQIEEEERAAGIVPPSVPRR